MTKLHCCIDLELEQPKTNPQTPDSQLDEEKIIQVGYVIYSLEPYQIIKKVSRFINIGVPLSDFIKKLTHISDEDIANGTDLQSVYGEMVALQRLHGFQRVVKQWGGGDMDCFQKELGDSVKWEFGRSGCNIKHMYQMYAEANGFNSSGGLSKSLAKCGLTWEGRGKHDALLDALNTANMHNFLYNKLKGKNE